MLSDAKEIISEFGVLGFLSLLTLVALAWIARIALKNPLEVVSGALEDVETARKALRDELAHAQKIIDDQRRVIALLESQIKEMKENDGSSL